MLQGLREIREVVKQRTGGANTNSDAAVFKMTQDLQKQQETLDQIKRDIRVGGNTAQQILVAAQGTRTDVRTGFTSMDTQFAVAERRSQTRHRALSSIAQGMSSLADSLKRYRPDDEAMEDEANVINERSVSPGHSYRSVRTFQ